MVGLFSLKSNPTEAQFYGVLRAMCEIITDTGLDAVFGAVGFDGTAGDAWRKYEEGKAPANTGKAILDLIFDQVVLEFCGGDLVWWVQSLSEDSDMLVDVANLAAIGKTQLTMKTEMKQILNFPTRVVNSMTWQRRCLGDVLLMTEAELKRLPNVGRKAIDELKAILLEHGYALHDSDIEMPSELIAFQEWRANDGRESVK